MLATALAESTPPPASRVAMLPPRAILALDLGSRCGWAVLPRSGRIASGVSEFRPGRFEGAGMAFLRFERFLGDATEASGPFGAVVFEEVRAHAGTLAAQVYGGFLAHLTAWCGRNAVPYRGVPIGTWKRFACEKGNASKQEVIAAMKRRGHDPRDDNEADALAVLYWAIATIGGADGR